MKLPVEQSANFLNAFLVRADPLSWCARVLSANMFFFASRYALVLLSSVRAWPFQQGASHRCAGFHHIAENFTIEIFEARFFAIALTPFLPTPSTRFQTPLDVVQFFCSTEDWLKLRICPRSAVSPAAYGHSHRARWSEQIKQ